MVSTIKVNTIKKNTGSTITIGEASASDTINIPTGVTFDINAGATIDATGATITGFGGASDEQVKVSADDTTPGFLNGKLTAGTSITLTEGSGGGDETLSIAYSTPATLPAASGVNLTALNASALGSGTVPTARLGSGTASSSTVLYGDQTYKAEPGGGKVLQVVTGYLDGQVSTTSATYADTGLDADITLASTSSKVLIQATLVSCYNNSVNYQGMFRIMRDDTTNLTPYPDSGAQGHIGIIYCPGEKINSTINFMFEDSPASTSSLNYSIYMAVQTGGDMRMNQNGQRSYIHLIEIGA